ncbi:MAG: DnaJ domain-containing protein [Bacteroidota bacterium]
MKNYYQILNLQTSSTKNEIKSSFRKLAKQLHPDINKSPDAHRKFIEINEAYEILSDNKKRADYDKLFSYANEVKSERYNDLFNTVNSWSREAAQRGESYAKMTYADYVKNVLGYVVFSVSYIFRFFFSILLFLFFGAWIYILLGWLIGDRNFSVYTIIGLIVFIILYWGMAGTTIGYIINIRRNFSNFNFEPEIGNKKRKYTSIFITVSLIIISAFHISQNIHSGQSDDYEEYKSIKAHDIGDVYLDFCPDNRHFVSGSGDGSIKIWDAETGDCLKTLYNREFNINVVKYSKDGRFVACGKDYSAISGHMSGKYDYKIDNISSDFNTIIVWDMITNEIVSSFGFAGLMKAIDFSFDNKMFAIGIDSRIYLYSLPDFIPIDTIGIKFNDFVKSLKDLSSEEKHEASTNYNNNSFNCLEFSPDNKSIATGGSNIILWDLKTRECKTLIGDQALVQCLDYSPDGKYIVTGGWEKSSIIVWDVNSGKKVSEYIDWGIPIITFKSFNSVKFSNDGKYIYTAADGNPSVRILDSKTCKQVCSLRKHEDDKVTSVCISLNEKYIISSDYSGNIKIWKRKK